MNSERGTTLIELLVSMTMLATLFAGVMSAYTFLTRSAYDSGIIVRTNEEARVALDAISYDVRMSGAGMPLGQSGFPPGDSTLGDAPLAVLTTSDNTQVRFRLNELGRGTVLMATFSPTSTNRTFTVYSAADLDVGDTLYISDASEGGSQGLKGVVESVSGNSVTIASGFVTGVGTISFASGSLVHRTTLVSYSNAADGSGILRDNETSSVVLLPGGTVGFRYFDRTGTELALPLTDSTIANTLTGIEISITAQSAAPLRSGGTYTTVSRQRIALRNLNFNR